MENKELQDYAISVAQTIWQQICAKDINIVMSWGVSKFGAVIKDNNPALFMQVNGFEFKGAVIVELNVMDTYDIYFMENGKCVHEIKGVYFEQLTDALDKYIEIGELTEKQYKEKCGKWLVETA